MNNEISDKIVASLKKRHRKEMIFKNAGVFSIILAITFLFILFVSIIEKGHSAFFHYQISLEVDLDKTLLEIDPQSEITPEILQSANYENAIKFALKNKFPEVGDIIQKSNLFSLLSRDAALDLKKQVVQNPSLINDKKDFWFNSSSDIEMYLKGNVSEETPQELRNIKDSQIAWIKILQSENKIIKKFNYDFFKLADSREPELAGMAASIAGSFFTMIIFLLAAFPIGVMSAFYLEELAPKNILTDIVEISINNLAAIPSVIFGLLGLIIYLNFFHLQRSSSLVGGLTLALLVLPIIIIATRNSIKSIPKSIKEAASALGASDLQIMFHHTLPLSMPGIMTGTILAISRALGETAPLLMIGMVAFIGDIPHGIHDPATAMPVQIYLWSDSSEIGFVERTAAAIMVLLGFLIFFNFIAIYLRKKFETKW